MRVALLLYCLPATALSMCFIEEDANGRRVVIRNATTVIDNYQCKIECAVRDDCLAYFYQAKGSQCVLLGPHEIEPLCAAPAKEFLKYLDDALCPTNDTKSVYNFKPNPIFENSSSFSPKKMNLPQACTDGFYVFDMNLPDGSHRIGSYEKDTRIFWDNMLLTWQYIGTINDYVRGTNCVLPPYNIANALPSSNCIGGILPPFPGMFANQTPAFNVADACGGKAIHYVRENKSTGSKNTTATSTDKVFCIYGSWFFVTVSSVKETLEILAASCDA